MQIVRSGHWLYANAVMQPVDIVGLPFDFWFELAKADGQLEADEESSPLGEGGLLYYVRFRHAGDSTEPTWPDSVGYSTIEAAMRAARNSVAAVIHWDQHGAQASDRAAASNET
ncbi:hypothetical protein ARHIZOSPH14_24960 [Agromyces rhizosphaerae]|uniref:Uncharacterized protein n=1 Tax=Agromyces rhizosphaerae TaxID=88374 RepID=A0A9W6CZR3_9MICO|nr:hypothetical protein [Agromyces rhizosphaerae]GLI28254.1 hypothetical protein ARHIZOSPH14_24960 [Agromyces rhizosphaerae]